jgi:hypothetical protein
MAAGSTLLGQGSPTDYVDEPVQVNHSMLTFTDRHVLSSFESSIASVLKEAVIILPRLHPSIGDEYLTGRGNNAAGLGAELETHFDLLDMLELLCDAQGIEDVHQVIEHYLFGVRAEVM